jgi:hypothetical protein
MALGRCATTTVIAGKRDALCLSGRERAAVIADDGLIAFGEAGDEIVNAGRLRGGDDRVRIGRLRVRHHSQYKWSHGRVAAAPFEGVAARYHS